MTALSQVTRLIATRAGDIERARDIFNDETRSFVNAVLGGLRKMRREPWEQARVRLLVPREVDSPRKAGGLLSSQYATATTELRFKMRTNFVCVADINFGIAYNPESETFQWQVDLIPDSKYQQIDDAVWMQWRLTPAAGALPGARHIERSNTVHFLARPIGDDLTVETAFGDVQTVLNFALGLDAPLAEAIGVMDAAIGGDGVAAVEG